MIIKPNQSFFLDDIDENIAIAKTKGFSTFHVSKTNKFVDFMPMERF
jgi:hypothetical protein